MTTTDQPDPEDVEDVEALVPISASHVQLGLPVLPGWTLPALRMAQIGHVPLDPGAPGSRARLGYFAWNVMGHVHVGG